ncbi:MAG: FkbM family methyltransferase [Ilumatobacteraceae bacterium]
MARNSTYKTIRVGLRSCRLAGDADDPYYASVGDGVDDDLGAFLHNYVAPDSVVIDVGANIGVTTLIMSQVVPSGSVVAIEAGRRNFTLLEENLKANGCSNVTAVFAAASRSAGTLEFAESTAYGGVVEGLREVGTGYSVPAITIDDLVADHGLERVDLLKVDVEGHEPDVLAGAEATIERFDPTVVLEFNLWTIMAYSDDNPLRVLRDLVGKFEYVGRILHDGSLARLGPDEVVGFVHEAVTSGDCVHNLAMKRQSAGFSPTEHAAPLPTPPHGAPALPAVVDAMNAPDDGDAVTDRIVELRERDALRLELTRLEERFNAVVNSRSWKSTEFLRRFGRKG